MVTDVIVINRIDIGSDHNGRLRYAKHRGKEEAPKQEYTNKSWHWNDWNEKELSVHVY